MRVPVRTGEPVDRRDRALGVAGAVHGPGREQRRGQIGDRPADRLRQIAGARRRYCLCLSACTPMHQARQRGRSCRPAATRSAYFDRLVDIAVDRERQEGAVEQLAVLRIVAQRRPVIGGRGGCIALLAGMAGGEIAAATAVMPERSCAVGVWADSSIGDADQKSGQARCRRTHRAKLEEVTGDAPMGRNRRGFAREPPRLRPRMAFLRRPRKNGQRGALSLQVESPDVAASWPRDRVGPITYSDNSGRRRLPAEPR